MNVVSQKTNPDAVSRQTRTTHLMQSPFSGVRCTAYIVFSDIPLGHGVRPVAIAELHGNHVAQDWPLFLALH